LAGNIYSDKAIRSIFELKNRPTDNPLIVHLADIGQLNEVAEEIPDKAKLLAKKYWPGPLTLLLQKKRSVSDLITAGKSMVAVRIPHHPLALEVLRKVKVPLAAPSANPYMGISPIKAQQVENYFGEKLSLILDGGVCKNGMESTIIGFDGDEVVLYRHGAISIEDIEKISGPLKLHTAVNDASKAASPGMHKKHYSPKTTTIVTRDPETFFSMHPDKRIGYISLRKYHPDISRQFQVVLSWKGDLKEASSRFYDSLHFLDAQNLDFILVKPFPNRGLGKTLNDRLSRACGA
jgi:L-threonylcarbamoyladenylate synthase